LDRGADAGTAGRAGWCRVGAVATNALRMIASTGLTL
jgi:hypothetical protein